MDSGTSQISPTQEKETLIVSYTLRFDRDILRKRYISTSRISSVDIHLYSLNLICQDQQIRVPFTLSVDRLVDPYPFTMRLLRSSLLALTSLTAFTSCVVATNPEKWSKLAESSSDGIIKLDSNSYDELLAPPRNYSVSVLLTALPASFNCAPCQ